MHLETKVTRNGYGNPLKGECDKDQLRSIQFLKLLGIEFIARAQSSMMLELCKQLFVVFADAQNDKAAKQALEAVYAFTLTMKGSYPAKMGISVEEFDAKERAEEKEFLDWLEKTFWSLSLYIPDTYEEKTSGDCYFSLRKGLEETKSAAIAYVAGMWSGCLDETALQAFEFLCNCYDSRRFAEKAKQTVGAVQAYREKYHRESTWHSFSIPKEDAEMVLTHLRSTMPTTIGPIIAWGARLDGRVPEDIRKLFGHAYVKAGGDVFSA